MCGICGFAGADFDREESRDLALRMASTMVHRGPDDSGVWVAGPGGAALGHRRLSIIDVAGGHQPMASEESGLVLVYNGETYNFRQLRRELEAKGHTFRTHSDTEVVLHLYEEEGPACVERMRGMFAFAVWDGRRRRLFLARDRLGQKPLFYARVGGGLVFSSELKGLLAFPGIERRVDPVALDRYLTYQYVPHPLTMFEGVRKVPPAHRATWEGGRFSLERYWEPDWAAQVPAGEREASGRIRELLAEATEMRMISDVPLGAFLSGGMDSSITVALMARASDKPVKTFSIGFRERKFDETDYARLVAERYGTDHTEFTVEPQCLEVLGKLAWHYDEPFADSSAIPTWYVSKMTASKVKVALSGDAGDENFAGYPRYRAVRLAHLYDRFPRLMKSFFSPRLWRHLPVSVEQKSIRRRAKKLVMALNLPPEERYLTWIAIFDEARKKALYAGGMSERLADEPAAAEFVLGAYRRAGGRDFLSRTTFVDLQTYLPCDLLTKVDVASMAHSLEVRSPFLDHRVVEAAVALPIELKMRRLSGKYLLKRAFADLVPREVITRPKMGFGVPISRWFRGELSSFLRHLLIDERSLSRGHFRPAAVRELIDEHTGGVFDHGYRLWSLVMLELWHRTFVDREPQGPLGGLEELL